MDKQMSSTSTAASRTELLAVYEENNLAGHKAFEARRYAQAEVRFLDALKAAEALVEESRAKEVKAGELAEDDVRRVDLVRLAHTLNNLAALYHLQGKFGFAEETYERCLDLKLDLYGEEHIETSINLHNLAVLHCAKKRWEKAELLYKRAIEIREKLLGKDDKQLVPILKNYAIMLRKLVREDEAQALEARALAIEPEVAAKLNLEDDSAESSASEKKSC